MWHPQVFIMRCQCSRQQQGADHGLCDRNKKGTLPLNCVIAVTDGTTTLTNTSGVSVGGKWDLEPIKTGGTRLDLDGICGKANERCAKDGVMRKRRG